MEQSIQKFPLLLLRPKPVFDLLSQPLVNEFHPITPLKQCPICYSFFSQLTKPDACNHFFVYLAFLIGPNIKNNAPYVVLNLKILYLYELYNL